MGGRSHCFVPGCNNSRYSCKWGLFPGGYLDGQVVYEKRRLCGSLMTRKGCENMSAACRSVKFHNVPKGELLRGNWLRAIQRDNYMVTDNSKVCSVHFFDGQKNGTLDCPCRFISRPLITERPALETANMVVMHTEASGVTFLHAEMKSDGLLHASPLPQEPHAAGPGRSGSGAEETLTITLAENEFGTLSSTWSEDRTGDGDGDSDECAMAMDGGEHSPYAMPTAGYASTDVALAADGESQEATAGEPRVVTPPGVGHLTQSAVPLHSASAAIAISAGKGPTASLTSSRKTAGTAARTQSAVSSAAGTLARQPRTPQDQYWSEPLKRLQQLAESQQDEICHLAKLVAQEQASHVRTQMEVQSLRQALAYCTCRSHDPTAMLSPAAAAAASSAARAPLGSYRLQRLQAASPRREGDRRPLNKKPQSRAAAAQPHASAPPVVQQQQPERLAADTPVPLAASSTTLSAEQTATNPLVVERRGTIAETQLPNGGTPTVAISHEVGQLHNGAPQARHPADAAREPGVLENGNGLFALPDVTPAAPFLHRPEEEKTVPSPAAAAPLREEQMGGDS